VEQEKTTQNHVTDGVYYRIRTGHMPNVCQNHIFACDHLHHMPWLMNL